MNVSSLALREGPTTAAAQIGTLHFNDEVEIRKPTRLGPGGDVRRDTHRWASMRYLQPVPADRPRSVPRKRPAPAPKEPAKPAPAPKARRTVFCGHNAKRKVGDEFRSGSFKDRKQGMRQVDWATLRGGTG